MNIIDLKDDADLIEQAAHLLNVEFLEIAPDAWNSMDEAREEVREFLDAERIMRLAVDDAGQVLGWIGGIPEYDGNVWELHPLVVGHEHQGRGIGRALVHDFERCCAERGGFTVRLGTDDETNRTSLGGMDVYPNVLENVLNIRNLKRHPYEFYQKCGFVIVGIMPDANGFGKPDIIMAKRIAKAEG